MDAETGERHLLRHVGSHVTLTQSRRSGPDIEVVGTIDRAERVPGMTITTDDGRYRACRFRVKPDDGSRAVWTHPLADIEAGQLPAPSTQEPTA